MGRWAGDCGAGRGPNFEATPRRAIDVNQSDYNLQFDPSYYHHPTSHDSNIDDALKMTDSGESDSGTDSDLDGVVDELSLAATLGTSPAWANIVK